MDEADQAAVAFGDQTVRLHTLIHESRKGPVGNFGRNMLPIETQVASPQSIPLHTVTRSHGSDLGHRTRSLRGNDILACLGRGVAQLSTMQGHPYRALYGLLSRTPVRVPASGTESPCY